MSLDFIPENLLVALTLSGLFLLAALVLYGSLRVATRRLRSPASAEEAARRWPAIWGS